MSDQRRLGRYVLDRKIATGGMAEIWLAHQAGPAGFAKEIVIKRILPHLADDAKFVEMFLDEARLAAALQHPNIAQIYDLGELDGSYFIAMEYIDGCDLEAVIQRSIEIGRFVPPPIAARLIADACAGLDYAHTYQDRAGRDVGLVHRDISPQNLLLSKGGIIKIVDFGVAKAATSSHKTQTGAVKGKLSYMSPEQISAQPLDGRSDVFSLGIVLYELTTNQRPFGHESELMAVTAILNEEPPAPRTLTAAVPEELEHIIYRALAKDRDERFASAGEMQLALEQYLQHHGALLTNRDISAYLADLFSDSPSGSIPALERQAGAQLGVGGTVAGVVSSPTRPHESAGTQTLVRDSDDDMPVPPRGRGALFAVMFLVLAVLVAAGFGIYQLVTAPEEGSGDEATAAADDTSAAGGGEQGEQAAAGSDGSDDRAPQQDEGVAEARAADTEPAQTGAPDTGTSNAANTPDTAPPLADIDAGSTADDDATVAAVDASGMVDTAIVPEPDATVAEEDATVAAAQPDATAEPRVDTEPEQSDTDEATSAEPTEPPVEERRPERPATGTVQVVVTTGGRQTVYIDGRQVGTLPGRNRFTLDEGQYSIRVVDGDGSEYTDTVRVEGGETVRVRARF